MASAVGGARGAPPPLARPATGALPASFATRKGERAPLASLWGSPLHAGTARWLPLSSQNVMKKLLHCTKSIEARRAIVFSNYALGKATSAGIELATCTGKVLTSTPGISALRHLRFCVLLGHIDTKHFEQMVTIGNMSTIRGWALLKVPQSVSRRLGGS